MHNTKLICKLEHTQALHNFARLAGAADAFIISRGNLGLHVPCEKIALVQKQLVSQCNHLGKPVIITRIVDTMVNVCVCVGVVRKRWGCLLLLLLLLLIYQLCVQRINVWLL